jgi:hypothetical protein
MTVLDFLERFLVGLPLHCFLLLPAQCLPPVISVSTFQYKPAQLRWQGSAGGHLPEWPGLAHSTIQRRFASFVVSQ